MALLIDREAERLCSILQQENCVEALTQFVKLAGQKKQQLKQVINRPVQLYNRCTAVHLAASKGLWECLELLLKNGGDPNAVSSETDLRQTPLHHAALNGRAKCLQILLDYGATMDRENARHETALDMVKGKPRCEKILEQAAAKIKIPNRTQEEERQVEELHRLASEGATEKFKQLYEALPEHRRDLSTRWNDLSQKTLLTRASIAFSISMEIAQYILSRSPNEPLPCISTGETPLLIAAQTGNVSLVWLLLEHSPGLLFKPTEGSKITPFHIACYNGDLDMVRLFLRSVQMSVAKGLKVSLNQRDMDGQTPFFCACHKGHLLVVEQLLEFARDNSPLVDLDVNLPLYDSKRTPLHIVTEKRSLEIARRLVQYPAICINVEAKPSRRVVALLLEGLQKQKAEGKEGVASGTDCLQSSTEVSGRPPSPSRGSNSSTPVLPSTPSCASPSPVTGGRTSAQGDKDVEVPSEASAKGPSRADTNPNIGVYVTESGNFEVRSLDPAETGQDFGQMSLTPLAEACITTLHKTMDMVRLYLEHGARDMNGVACRIALALGKPQVAWEILSYQCVATVGSYPSSDKTAADLCLKWSGKRLPMVHGQWFVDSSMPFHPLFVNDEEEAQILAGSGVYSHMSSQSWTFVTTVELQKNSLKEVPLELFQLKNVRAIDLSQNRITTLPAGQGQEGGGAQWHCPHLEVLLLNENQLESLPVCIWGLKSLSNLLVNNNKIETLASPDEPLCLHSALENIELSFNSMTSVSEFIFKLPSLKKVALNNNRLTSLPGTVWENRTLKELNVAHNFISVLSGYKATPISSSHLQTDSRSMPTEKRLIARVEVRLPAKPLDTAKQQQQPEAIQPLDEKEELCWSNYLAPASERCEHSSLSKLDLSSNRFTKFPEALACLAPNLVELDMSSNSFAELHLCLLPQTLQKFTAKHCEMRWMGYDPGMLKEQFGTSLKACCHTVDSDLPCEHRNHRQLPLLVTLILQKNRLQRFALSSSGGNELEERGGGGEGEDLSPLSSTLDLFYPVLGGLDLSHNDLRGTFTREIKFQFHLKWIKLGDNPLLEKLPMEFGYLKNTRQFTELSIDNLPNLVDPPKEYQSLNLHNLNHLLNYMRARLKKSVFYRTIKLFLIGREERGKSTLLRRLKGLPEQQLGRTVGIDIADWEYPEPSSMQLHRQEKVRYILWDFAGQDVYSTTHQCFYSRRSLYLALFRLTDGEEGVKELEPWLRNVQLRAPGCPVIIVGTHLDRVSSQRAQELVLYASQCYQNTLTYPKVLSVMPVSSTQKNIFAKNNIEALRKYIYHVSCHLQVSGQDGISLEYKKDAPENDPKALFQQQIPKSFLDLQDRIRDEVASRPSTGDSPPIMDDEQFQAKFGVIFDDRDDLQEAVYFLHLQGTLLHFEDVGLRNIYFLDPQWLAKLMADVINPSATNNLSINNGIGKVSELFDTREVKKELKENYVQLLQKFEVALKLNKTHVIIPSLMPLSAQYPPPCDTPAEGFLPLRRVWLSRFILDGFWPRLISRVAVDKHIVKTLDSIVGTTTTLDGCGDLDIPVSNWIMWKTGLVYAYSKQTLLVVKQESNGVSLVPEGMNCLLEGGVRVELVVYLSTVKSLMLVKEDSLPIAKATQLLMMISQHITSLVTDWFPGMLLGVQEPRTYIPCWKCVNHGDQKDDATGNRAAYSSASGILWAPDHPVHLFVADECIVPAVREERLECPVHGELNLTALAPDLTFLDIEGDAGGTLNILTNELLGKGGYGFVSKGILTTQENHSDGVAVKVFLQSSTDLNTVSQSELKKYTTDPKQLVFSYQQIRREVSFLSNLNNAYLTQLCGVKMKPYMCLLLELAPQKNLRHHLKLYKELGQSLEPFTLKVTVKQIVEALEYLHGQQVVHLDVKSSNVLVWHFPSPTTNRKQRHFHAGNVYVKLADYGISQLSTGAMIKLVNNPVGTPGYMAPEMFGGVREVTAEKLDIFAFGMTVYEMLSLRVPFDDVKAVIKRNHEVKNGGRPTLRGKEIRTPIIAQDLMALCWDQDPEKRPRMRQIKEWLLASEFELLRSEISLGSVKTISCACVCRITPEQEEEGDLQGTSNPLDLKSDGLCLESSMGTKQDSTCFLLSAPTASYDGKGLHENQPPQSNQPLQSSNLNTSQTSQPFRSSSQIWLCGRDQRKGMIQIFKYYDSQPDTYLLTGYLSNVDEVAALCPVKNMMWMGTDSGSLVVCHAPSLKIVHTYKLSKGGNAVFDIVHVEEVGTVVVTTRRGELWCLKDHAGPAGLQVVQMLQATDAVYRLVKVVTQGSIQVWGSMDNNTVFLMEWGGGKDKEGWKRVPLPPCDSGNSKIVLQSCVAHSSFVDTSGSHRDYVWIAYRNRSIIVCWDAREKYQLIKHTLDCSKVLSTDRYRQQITDNAPPPDKCESLATYKKKLFVGTTGGCVLVVDAERCVVTNVLSWHMGKVRMLLVMPKQMEPCVCAEVHFGEDEEEEGVAEGVEELSLADNPHKIHNLSDPDACMIVSIGNGRRKSTVVKQPSGQQYTHNALSTRIEDLYLLTWKS